MFLYRFGKTDIVKILEKQDQLKQKNLVYFNYLKDFRIL